MPTTFRSLPLDAPLLAVVDELGFRELTPVQAETIPPLLAGRDVVGQARTGSGKTAAFVLPLLQKLALEKRALQALVLCPTRELCGQVARETRTFGRRLPGLHVLEVAGGATARPQLEALARGVHVAVGTPGRVLDLLRRGSIDLASVNTVVLDEADRMLDMGFEKDMRAILKALPRARQTAFFSATFPEAIDAMSAAFQRDAVRVTVDDGSADSPAIRQLVYSAEPSEKVAATLRALRAHPHEAALVFCNLKATAAELETALRGGGISAEALHGDLEQRDRDRVMAKFRNGSTRVLVATDVAARGIDVAGLDLVINHDLPAQPEVYVHRIGRTGRAGRAGLAISLVSRGDESRLAGIVRVTGAPLERATHAEAPRANAAPAASMVTLYVSGGRKDKLRPGDLLGALTGEAGGLAADQVGKIEIHDHFAYVAVSRDVVRTALEGLANGRIKGRKFKVGRVE